MKKSRKCNVRRDRRKAKLSGWLREPKGSKVGHGTSVNKTSTINTTGERKLSPSQKRTLKARARRARKAAEALLAADGMVFGGLDCYGVLS